MGLYTSPWVSGTRAAAYFGPISSYLFVQDKPKGGRRAVWDRAMNELLSNLRDNAFSLGANAVVGLEVSADPFGISKESEEPGLALYAIGTAARLEDLW